jgi:hypothetical protein
MSSRWAILIGMAAGFAVSDVWHSWWNLTVPLGVALVAGLLLAKRSERDSNPRELPPPR